MPAKVSGIVFLIAVLFCRIAPASAAPPGLQFRFKLISPPATSWMAQASQTYCTAFAGQKLWTTNFCERASPTSAAEISGGESNALNQEERFRSGSWTPWFPVPFLPGGYHNKASVVFVLKKPDGQVIAPARMRVQFSDSTGKIFNDAEEPTADGAIELVFPVSREQDAKSFCMTWSQYCDRRYDYLKRLNLSPLPELKHLRLEVAARISSTPELAEKELRILRLMGINTLGVSHAGMPRGGYGYQPDIPEELYKKYGILSTSLTCWPQIGSLDPSTPDALQFWREQVKNQYQAVADILKHTRGPAFRRLYHLKVADEVGPVISMNSDWPPALNRTPCLLAQFRSYLAERGLTPQFFGKKDLEQVSGTVLSAAEAKEAALPEKMLFYHSAEFSAYLTALYWRMVRETIEEYFGGQVLTAENFQAEPMQHGGLYAGFMDPFLTARMGGHSMLWTEDWTEWVEGVAYGADIFRSASMEGGNLPLGHYRIMHHARGSVANIIVFFAHGTTLLCFATYGPLGSWWRTFEDDPEALTAIARASRILAPAEAIIAKGKLRPSGVAIHLGKAHELWRMATPDFTNTHKIAWSRRELHYALLAAHLRTDFISDNAVLLDKALGRYKILFLLDPQIASEVQKAIIEWVKTGGCLVATPEAGSRDEYDEPASSLSALLKQALLSSPCALGKGKVWMTESWKAEEVKKILSSAEISAPFETSSSQVFGTVYDAPGGSAIVLYESPAWGEPLFAEPIDLTVKIPRIGTYSKIVSSVHGQLKPVAKDKDTTTLSFKFKEADILSILTTKPANKE